MRINLPVTQNEYVIPADQTLVSVTDMKGRITYCNPAFIDVSGFTRDELLGQPHNLVRHPDMPEEAFRDMWESIQGGLPWSGLVKNRRKNGEYYWVQANATPMTDGEQITGYLSVRTVPSREAVAGAERLYAVLRDEAETGRVRHGLHRGRVVRRDWVGRMLGLLNPGTEGRLLLIQALAAALLLGAALIDLPISALLGIALVSIGGSFWALRRLTLKPLHALVTEANCLAAGDLSRQIRTGDRGLIGQLQQALMQMSVNLRTVVQDVRGEIDHLNRASHEIADGNQDLSSRTESQAGRLQETAASMEEITGIVQQSANAASHGASMAHETSSITERGNEAVRAVAQTMTDIMASSKRIEDIVQLVEGVAFQTNILALNAAVEAARAGDAGRGFAVVASEVRTLAQRTTEAARDIRHLIMESSQRVVLGNTQTREAIAKMTEAIEAVTKVSTALDEISTASVEQKNGISQINEAVSHMDSITQQNAALVEQLAASAQSLRSQVGGVSNSMRLFRLVRGELSLSQIDAVGLRRDAKLLAAY